MGASGRTSVVASLVLLVDWLLGVNLLLRLRANLRVVLVLLVNAWLAVGRLATVAIAGLTANSDRDAWLLCDNDTWGLVMVVAHHRGSEDAHAVGWKVSGGSDVDADAEEGHLEETPEEESGIKSCNIVENFVLPNAVRDEQGHLQDQANHKLALGDAVVADVRQLSESEPVAQAQDLEERDDAEDPAHPKLASPHGVGREDVGVPEEKAFRALIVDSDDVDRVEDDDEQAHHEVDGSTFLHVRMVGLEVQ